MRILPIFATLALAAATTAAAGAAEQDATVLQLLQAPARLSIVDAGGRTVGQLVANEDGSYRLRVIGSTRTPDVGRDHASTPPTQSNALTPWQMQAQQEALRRSVFEPVMTGP